MAATSAPPPPVDRQVRQRGRDIEHLRALMQQTPASLTGNAIGIGLVLAIFGSLSTPEVIGSWGAVSLLAWVLRLAHYRRCQAVAFRPRLQPVPEPWHQPSGGKHRQPPGNDQKRKLRKRAGSCRPVHRPLPAFIKARAYLIKEIRLIRHPLPRLSPSLPV